MTSYRHGSVFRSSAIVFLIALVLYMITVAPGPLWQDSGLAQLRVLRYDIRGELGLALSHPLYYAIAIGFQAIPFGESAWKTNLVSAVFGAATVTGVFAALLLCTRKVVPAVVGAASLAVAHTFWQHCALAEVYTVSTALIAMEIVCLVQFVRTRRVGWLVGLFFFNGLGISNHLIAILHLPVWGVLVVWWMLQKRVRIGVVAGSAMAWLGGAGLYLGLMLADWFAGRPIGEVVRSALFGDHYAGNVTNVAISPDLLINSVLYLGLNFPTPAVLLTLVGIVGAGKGLCIAATSDSPTKTDGSPPGRSTDSDRDTGYQPDESRSTDNSAPKAGVSNRPIGVALIAMLAIHLLWAIRYDVPDQYTFFIPAVMLIAVFIGLGASCIRFAMRPAGAAVLIVAAALPAIVYIPLPVIAERAGVKLGVGRPLPYRDSYRYFLWPWKTREYGPQHFAAEIHDTLPDGAVLIADDTSVRPIHYLMLTGRWRRDVEVWPPLEPDTPSGNAWPAPADVADAIQFGRLYTVSDRPRYCPDWILKNYRLDPSGIVFRVASEVR